MKVGDLVKVETKYYGTKMGVIIKHGMDGYFIQPVDHARMIVARPEDLKVISKRDSHNHGSANRRALHDYWCCQPV